MATEVQHQSSHPPHRHSDSEVAVLEANEKERADVDQVAKESNGAAKSGFTNVTIGLRYAKSDPKFSKFGDGLGQDDKEQDMKEESDLDDEEQGFDARSKKIKMSDSFLAAKATYQRQKAVPTKEESSKSNDVIYPETTAETGLVFAKQTDVTNGLSCSQLATLEKKKKLSEADKLTQATVDEMITEHFGSDLSIIKRATAAAAAAGVDICDVDEEEISTGNGARRGFICRTNDCNQTFPTRKELRRHKMSHRIRKHICPMQGCGRAFFEKSKLRRHMVVHTKQKEFSCPICGKNFGYKANVKTHLRTHTGERPFMCRISSCGKTFAQASNRNAHERTHFKSPELRKRNRGSLKPVKTRLDRSPSTTSALSIESANHSSATSDSGLGSGSGSNSGQSTGTSVGTVKSKSSASTRGKKRKSPLPKTKPSTKNHTRLTALMKRTTLSPSMSLDISEAERATPKQNQEVTNIFGDTSTSTATDSVRRSARIRNRGSKKETESSTASVIESSPFTFDVMRQFPFFRDTPSGTEALANDTSFFDLDEVVNDICKLNTTAEEAQDSKEAVSGDTSLVNSSAEKTDDASSLGNFLFNSFTSFSSNSFHEAELNKMFKNEFGLNLDTLTENDTFLTPNLTTFSPFESNQLTNIGITNAFLTRSLDTNPLDFDSTIVEQKISQQASETFATVPSSQPGDSSALAIGGAMSSDTCGEDCQLSSMDGIVSEKDKKLH